MSLLDFADKVTFKADPGGGITSDNQDANHIISELGIDKLEDMKFMVSFFDMRHEDRFDEGKLGKLKSIYSFAKQMAPKDVPTFLRELKMQIGNRSGRHIEDMYSWVELHRERVEALNRVALTDAELSAMEHGNSNHIRRR